MPTQQGPSQAAWKTAISPRTGQPYKNRSTYFRDRRLKLLTVTGAWTAAGQKLAAKTGAGAVSPAKPAPSVSSSPKPPHVPLHLRTKKAQAALARAKAAITTRPIRSAAELSERALPEAIETITRMAHNMAHDNGEWRAVEKIEMTNLDLQRRLQDQLVDEMMARFATILDRGFHQPTIGIEVTLPALRALQNALTRSLRERGDDRPA